MLCTAPARVFMHAGICAFAVGHNDATTYSSCAAATADAGARSKVTRHGDANHCWGRTGG